MLVTVVDMISMKSSDQSSAQVAFDQDFDDEAYLTYTLEELTHHALGKFNPTHYLLPFTKPGY